MALTTSLKKSLSTLLPSILINSSSLCKTKQMTPLMTPSRTSLIGSFKVQCELQKSIKQSVANS